MSYTINKHRFFEYMGKLGCRNITAFSQYSGIHRSTINAYLNGKPVFSSAFLQLAAKLQVSPLQLTCDGQHDDANMKYLQSKLRDIAKCYSKLVFCLLGSRANNTAHTFSDWDIGISGGDTPIHSNDYLAIKQDIDDALDDWHYDVDVIHMDAAPKWFLAQIVYTPILLAGNTQTYHYTRGKIHGIQQTG